MPGISGRVDDRDPRRLLRLFSHRRREGVQLLTGLLSPDPPVFHLLPAKVDTNSVYSWKAGLLFINTSSGW